MSRHSALDRGADIDSKGVVWVSLGSEHLGSFDRHKCRGPLSGPDATGDQCPDGWTLYQYPGPGFAGIGDNSAEASYYTWVDQHNTPGLGNDVPISTGNENDALLALVEGKRVVLRVPYPLSFYAKGMDGRIDDADAGWKGRGVWTTSGDRCRASRKAARVRFRSPSISSCAPTPSPIDGASRRADSEEANSGSRGSEGRRSTQSRPCSPGLS